MRKKEESNLEANNLDRSFLCQRGSGTSLINYGHSVLLASYNAEKYERAVKHEARPGNGFMKSLQNTVR